MVAFVDAIIYLAAPKLPGLIPLDQHFYDPRISGVEVRREETYVSITPVIASPSPTESGWLKEGHCW
ncbi:MAG TPA: hypothetical protein VE439_08075 [Anaerolineae bacterium]|nr:hypothetical protein [Anaerolineae bacterium]